MVWHILSFLTSFSFPAFYKRIQGKNVKNLKVKGPVVIAMNHPNAFTDPVVFTYLAYPLKPRYLARGDAFKPGIISWLLEQIGIVPIFRIQDGGREGLEKNDETYRKVNRLLKGNKKIIVFAEGLCVQERRLRPLKKGVARMIFGAYEQLNNDDLMVIPVGVNYSQPDKFRSSLFYNVGEPIFVKEFIQDYNNNPARGNKLFLQALEPKMKELITHINNKDYDEVVPQIEILCKSKMMQAQGYDLKNLEHDFNVTKQITEKVNAAELDNKASLDEFKAKASVYFQELKKNNLRDWLIDPDQKHKVNYLTLYFRMILLFVGFPFYLTGVIGNYLPYKLTEKLTKKLVKRSVEFYSSIIIGTGIAIFLLNYIVWFTGIYIFSTSIGFPLIVCTILFLCGWFGREYHFFKIKTFGIFRALRYGHALDHFAEKRAELITLINKFYIPV